MISDWHQVVWWHSVRRRYWFQGGRLGRGDAGLSSAQCCLPDSCPQSLAKLFCQDGTMDRTLDYKSETCVPGPILCPFWDVTSFISVRWEASYLHKIKENLVPAFFPQPFHPPSSLPYHFPTHYFPLILNLFSFSRYFKSLKRTVVLSVSTDSLLNSFFFFFVNNILSHYFPSDTFSDSFLQREEWFFFCFVPWAV